MTMRTRFAPSPTGYLHIGGARTGLYCWLMAKRTGGTFVLRIEDTDRERSTDESVQAILDSMSWLGLEADEGPYFQTHRFDRYKEVVQQLLDEDKAYYCYCTKEELDQMREEQRAQGIKPRYDGRWRDKKTPREGVDPVVRFKNPQTGETVVEDEVHGRVVVQNSELDDLIIARSDGTPTYNFTVVVDDWDMKITHVIRGDDHLNNTPRQINIFKALGATPPKFAHVPMILGSDGSRLSKRHGAVSVMEYEKQGFLPEALLNYLVRLGWSHGDQEVFSMEEMINLFDLKDVNKSPSTFNPEKLEWLNQEYLKTGDLDRLGELLKRQHQEIGLDTSQGPEESRVVEAYRERFKTLREMAMTTRYLYEDFDQHYEEKAAKKNLRPVSKGPLQALRAAFEKLGEWNPETIQACVHQVTEALELGFGKVAQPLRVAVTGSSMSPAINVTLDLVGRDRTLRRLDEAIAFIEAKEAES